MGGVTKSRVFKARKHCHARSYLGGHRELLTTRTVTVSGLSDNLWVGHGVLVLA